MKAKVRFTDTEVNINLEYKNGIPIFVDQSGNIYFYKELIFINS